MKDWNERSAEERAAIERAIYRAVREADGKVRQAEPWFARKLAA